jgi:hypothetical protein
VSCEPFFRTLQLIEYFYDEEDPDSMNQDTRLSVEEARAVTGGGRPSPMVAPVILEHVSKELERVGGIEKNARKLREERAAAKSIKPGEGGGKGGKGKRGGMRKRGGRLGNRTVDGRMICSTTTPAPAVTGPAAMCTSAA